MKTKIHKAITAILVTVASMHANSAVVSTTTLYAYRLTVCVNGQVMSFQEQLDAFGDTWYVRIGGSTGNCLDTHYDYDISQLPADQVVMEWKRKNRK